MAKYIIVTLAFVVLLSPSFHACTRIDGGKASKGMEGGKAPGEDMEPREMKGREQMKHK